MRTITPSNKIATGGAARGRAAVKRKPLYDRAAVLTETQGAVETLYRLIKRHDLVCASPRRDRALEGDLGCIALSIALPQVMDACTAFAATTTAEKRLAARDLVKSGSNRFGDYAPGFRDWLENDSEINEEERIAARRVASALEELGNRNDELEALRMKRLRAEWADERARDVVTQLELLPNTQTEAGS